MRYPLWYQKRYRTVVKRREKATGRMVTVLDVTTPLFMGDALRVVKDALRKDDAYDDWCELDQSWICILPDPLWLLALAGGYVLVEVGLGLYRFLRALP